jgi:hypothetical protein
MRGGRIARKKWFSIARPRGLPGQQRHNFDPKKFKGDVETALRKLARRQAKGRAIEPPEPRGATIRRRANCSRVLRDEHPIYQNGNTRSRGSHTGAR